MDPTAELIDVDDSCRRILSLRPHNMQHVQWVGGLVEKASGMSRVRLHSGHFGSSADFLCLAVDK